MFPYTEKYKESQYDIQNNNLLYNIHHKCPNTFEQIDVSKFSKTINKQQCELLLFYLYKFHNWYFVIFVFSYIFVYSVIIASW